jgi:hypothetical protein
MKKSLPHNVIAAASLIWQKKMTMHSYQGHERAQHVSGQRLNYLVCPELRDILDLLEQVPNFNYKP